MQINVVMDNTQLLLRLRNGQKRLAYAAVNAVNNTLKRIQKAEQRRVTQEFTVRKDEFIKRQAAIIKPFASVKQARAFGEIAVGEKPRLLLSQFERGAKREPATSGARYVAEPVIGGPARPSFRRPVSPDYRLRKLKFQRTSTGKIRKSVAATKTFLVAGVGIFQRTGADAARAVYIFTRGKRLRPRLKFVETARREADRWFREEFEREVIKALERARGRGL